MEKPTSCSVNVRIAGTASKLVATVADLMSTYMQCGLLNNLSVFTDLCLSLANACKVGWFRNEDADDLLKLIQEVSRYFSSAEDIGVDPSYVHPYVSKVLGRFCPKLRMDRIIAAFQIKPGFGAFHADFHIIRGTVSPGKDEILLPVTNADNMETSSCIIAPPETSFLLNGKRLEGKTKDSRLQFPTNITKMLKYGVNLLQVIGQFNGHYIAVIGIMSLLPSLESHGIKDCSTALSLARSDMEIVETSSIPLNWPISNSCQILNEAHDEVVELIRPNVSWKPILQDSSVSSQIYSKSQSIEQLTHENKYSMCHATLDKIQMPKKPGILVHASVSVTSAKTNALAVAGYSQQPQRTFLVSSRLATCGDSSTLCSAMVNHLEKRIDLKQESLVAPRTNNWIPSGKMREGQP